jgi:surface polysaccharide O-acyltransferase-like enzyme
LHNTKEIFLPYINVFRAIASLFVVSYHGIHGLQWGAEYGNLEMSRALKILFSNGTLMFVFISGFLFQHLLYKYNYRNYVVTRFKLVILPYLVVSIPAVIAWTFLFQKSSWGIPHNFYSEPWWYRAGFFYISGKHMAPLWFIPMIAIFYLLSPLFKLIDRFPIIYLSIPFLMWLSYEQPRHWSPWISFIHFFPFILLVWRSADTRVLS